MAASYATCARSHHNTTGGEMTGTVQLAYLHTSRVSHSWHLSMRNLREYDRANGGHLLDRDMSIRTHPIRMVQSRNLVAKALLDKVPDAEWLLWVDTDMGFAPDALARLLKVADPQTAPVVGALCFSHMESGWDGMGGYRFDIVPTMYKIGDDERGHKSYCQWNEPIPDDDIVKVAATGSALILIHRSVFERVRAAHGDTWYDQMSNPSGVVGEDISFCLKVIALEIPIVVDTGTKTTHHKEIWLSEEDYQILRVAEHAVETMNNPAPELPIFTNLDATLAALAANEHDHDGMLKFTQDLDRYAQVIADTAPEVIVETGTHTGASARWFLARGVDVVTVDVTPFEFEGAPIGAHAVTGDSADPAVVDRVRQLVAGRRCMVVLDSDHSAEHVKRETYAYAPLVSPGCYLVVEDTIFGYSQAAHDAHIPGQLGSPLDAVRTCLASVQGDTYAAFSRDVAIEQMHPIGANPAGWWVRNG